MQVALNPTDAADCDYTSANVTIPARVEFTRASSVAGAPIIGLPSRPVTAVTAANSTKTAWSYPMALVPGTYDVYIQPTSSTDRCPLPPRLLRGVEVPEVVAGWAVPATLDLPHATYLSGDVQRRSGTLMGWKVDVVDPQEGRVLSTSSTLGSTGAGKVTNFAVYYQAVGTPAANSDGANATLPTGTSALLRMMPPENVAAPTVYWDLAVADLNGDGKLDLDMSGVPAPDQLVHVDGRVQGLASDDGAPATLRFASVTLTGAMALTATFNRTVKTDDQGRYGVDLFPGEYRVVASPAALSKDGGYGRTASMSSSPWALTETRAIVTRPQTPFLSIRLSPKRVVRGMGLAGPDGDAALGATFAANPTLTADDFGVLRGALAQATVLPSGASVTLGERGSFSVALDPGTFDLSLRPKDGSNFAWWVAPGVTLSAPTDADDVMSLSPRLPLPVAIEGVMRAPADATETNPSPTKRGLSNASVQVYARAPKGSAVTRVAETRTDANGQYRLSLPATFGTP
jgi:hypothetical protein